MAGIYVKDKGIWKLPKSVWVKSGTWHVCKNVYVKQGGSWRELIKTIDITSNQNNFNLYSYLGSPSQALSVVVNIASNVTIGSSGPTLPQWCPHKCTTTRKNLPKRPTAFTVGNFPTGSTVIINNNGYISGGGGYGGAGGNSFAKGPRYPYELDGSNGGDGGDGIVKGSSRNFDISLVNTGTIGGGGGGGGGGGSYFYPSQGQFQPGYNTSGGNGGDGAGVTGYKKTQGGSSSSNTDNNVTGIDGGQGGALGENGQAGQQAKSTKNGAGGKAGKAVGSGIEIVESGAIIGATG